MEMDLSVVKNSVKVYRQKVICIVSYNLNVLLKKSGLEIPMPCLRPAHPCPLCPDPPPRGLCFAATWWDGAVPISFQAKKQCAEERGDWLLSSWVEAHGGPHRLGWAGLLAEFLQRTGCWSASSCPPLCVSPFIHSHQSCDCCLPPVISWRAHHALNLILLLVSY